MAVILCFAQNNDGGGVVELDKAFLEMHEDGAAGASSFAQLAREVGEQSGVTEAGLGDGDGLVRARIELVFPVAHEVAFAGAVGPAEQHEAAQGGAGRRSG